MQQRWLPAQLEQRGGAQVGPPVQQRWLPAQLEQRGVVQVGPRVQQRWLPAHPGPLAPDNSTAAAGPVGYVSGASQAQLRPWPSAPRPASPLRPGPLRGWQSAAQARRVRPAGHVSAGVIYNRYCRRGPSSLARSRGTGRLGRLTWSSIRTCACAAQARRSPRSRCAASSASQSPASPTISSPALFWCLLQHVAGMCVVKSIGLRPNWKGVPG